jgi:hypothetical protein
MILNNLLSIGVRLRFSSLPLPSSCFIGIPLFLNIFHKYLSRCSKTFFKVEIHYLISRAETIHKTYYESHSFLPKLGMILFCFIVSLFVYLLCFVLLVVSIQTLCFQCDSSFSFEYLLIVFFGELGILFIISNLIIWSLQIIGILLFLSKNSDINLYNPFYVINVLVEACISVTISVGFFIYGLLLSCKKLYSFDGMTPALNIEVVKVSVIVIV